MLKLLERLGRALSACDDVNRRREIARLINVLQSGQYTNADLVKIALVS